MKYFESLTTKGVLFISIGFILGGAFKILEINIIYGLIILCGLWLGANLKEKGYLKLKRTSILKYKDICK
ncbi:MAG: hypothetical protein ACRCX8_17350 [Sarcina sp.]